MEGIPPQVLAQLIARTPDDTTTIVVMTCGISGSGKSTLAKSICGLKYSQYASLISNPLRLHASSAPFLDGPESRSEVSDQAMEMPKTSGMGSGVGQPPQGTAVEFRVLMNNYPKVITLADRGARDDGDSPQHDAATTPIPVNGNQDVLRSFQEREYIRLSIDQYIWNHHGGYAIDYPPEKYSDYQSEASGELDKLFVWLLKRNGVRASDQEAVQPPRRPLTIVLDYSFATKADRDEVKEIVEREGGRWVLVYFAISGDRQAIRERVRGRKSKRDVESGVCDGDNAFEVTDEVLDTYFASFQVPRGEGEIVIH